MVLILGSVILIIDNLVGTPPLLEDLPIFESEITPFLEALGLNCARFCIADRAAKLAIGNRLLCKPLFWLDDVDVNSLLNLNAPTWGTFLEFKLAYVGFVLGVACGNLGTMTLSSSSGFMPGLLTPFA